MNDLSLRLCGKPLNVMQMESWEAGIRNWTRGFEKEFEKRNGYSILPWLPVMAGGRAGKNQGDDCPQRKTFVTYNYFDKNSKPEPSGLTGPVKIEFYQTGAGPR